MKAMLRRGFQPDRSRAATPWWNGTDIAIREAAEREVDYADHHDTDLVVMDQQIVPTEAEVRETLRLKIVQRELITDALDRCTENEQRAQRRVADLTTRLGHYADLNAELLEHTLDAIRRDVNESLPPHLIAKRTERDRLADRFTLEEAAQQRITAQVKLGEAAVRACQQEVAEAATGVIEAAYMDRLAQCEELEQQASALRSEIASFAATWFPVAPVSNDIGTTPDGQAMTVAPSVQPTKSRRIAAFLQTRPVNADAQADPDTQAAIREAHAALQTDPRAPVD